MLRSMTAYGRASVETLLGRFVVELHSVNRKHLEINTYLPKEFLRYDTEIKKLIASEVGRGNVTVKIFVTFDQKSPTKIVPNLALARQIKDVWNLVTEDLGISELSDDRLLSILVNEPGILTFTENDIEEELYLAALKEATREALKHFCAMKESEGQALYVDIATRFAHISKTIKEIQKKAPEVTVKYRQRLIDRLQEALNHSLENEERIIREVCLYAEKVDIIEELIRFESHLVQINELLESPNPSVGKTLDFLVQELNREINTIGSKASDLEISRFVVEVKGELERIREQIQNVE